MSDIKPKQKNQASALESLRRTRRAQDLLVQGYTSRQVQKSLQDEFKIQSRQAQSYIQKAHETFIEENPENRKLLRAKYTSMLLDLYRKSYAKEHVKVCRDILESLVKIGGLSETVIENQSDIKITYNIASKKESEK